MFVSRLLFMSLNWWHVHEEAGGSWRLVALQAGVRWTGLFCAFLIFSYTSPRCSGGSTLGAGDRRGRGFSTAGTLPPSSPSPGSGPFTSPSPPPTTSPPSSAASASPAAAPAPAVATTASVSGHGARWNRPGCSEQGDHLG